ncbi:hypothetical protein K438DRAFT_2022058 [Mycena galopus ATCC 62051]|nr:hypothetical protein K438DRAFT_2022058 [Mycena galopus ATCC 62051]
MLLPLAALALFATSSLFGPASVLFRSIRRVVQPPTRTAAERPPEDETAAAKAANFLSAVFLRAFTSIVASVVQESPSATLLPIFHDQGGPISSGTPIPVSRASHEASALVNTPAESKAEVVGPASVGDVHVAAEPDAIPLRAASPPCPQRRIQRLQRPPSSQLAYVDFTIGWEDVWPERCLPSPQVKYTFNSYFNAFAVSASQEPPPFPLSVSGSSADSDVSSYSDSEVDAFELASCSADEDLLWALHSLSISIPKFSSPGARSPCSAPDPQAGLSPFCPPPLLTSNPPQSTMTWRLEWY